MQLDQSPSHAKFHAEAVARRQRLWLGRKQRALAPPPSAEVQACEPAQIVPKVERPKDGRATSYIRFLCAESPFAYEDVLGKSRRWGLTQFRLQLYVSVNKKYPQLSLSQIGAIFNRDHTTILSALKAAGRVTQPKCKVTADMEERMTALRQSGLSYSHIGAELGVSATTVGDYLRRLGQLNASAEAMLQREAA